MTGARADTRRAEVPDASAPPPISIVTFNIRNGGADDGPNSWRFRRDWVPGFIRGLQADVIGLQEAFDYQVDAVAEGLPGYGRVGVGRDDGARDGEHCPIYYRASRFVAAAAGTFWFSDTPDAPGSCTWGNTLPRICTWALLTDTRTGQAIRVCNLHLDHADRNARLRSVELLAQRVAEWRPFSPVVVMGDFNAGEKDPAMARLLVGGLTGLADTFRAVYPDAEAVATYHAFEGTERGAKIDHILATPDLVVQGAAIVRRTVDGRYPSDHFPVMAVLAPGRADRQAGAANR